MAMHLVRIGHPPEIEPIRIELVIGDHDQSLWETGLETPIFGTQQLSSNACISTDSHHGWTEPLGDCNDEQSEQLFGQCHVRIVVVPVYKI